MVCFVWFQDKGVDLEINLIAPGEVVVVFSFMWVIAL